MSQEGPRGNIQQNRRPLAERAVMVIGTAGSVASLIATEASERGARVAFATKDATGEGVGNGSTSLTSDLDCEATIDRLYDVVLERLSGLDVVIVVLEALALHALHTVPLELWRRQIADPLRKSFWLAQRALDEFVGSGNGGRLIFVIDRPDTETVGDGTGIISEAVASLARSLAREYGRWAVSSHVVVQSGSVGPAPSGGDSHHPLVECVLFLASPAASFVNGEMVMVGSAVTPPLVSARTR